VINPQIFRSLSIRGINKTTYLLLALALLLYSGFWTYYHFSTQEASKKARVSRCLEEQTLAFEGEVSRVSRYEYDNSMNKNIFGVSIRTKDSAKNFIEWQFKVEDDVILLKFISVGQKISKKSGSKKFTLTAANGMNQEFNIPYCK
jgi:hypothetical protein